MAGTISVAKAARNADGAAAQVVVAMCGARPLEAPSRHALDGLDTVTIGRGDPRATRLGRGLIIKLPDGAVSTVHATLLRAQGRWLLEDSGSKNGTFLNGARVRRSALLDGNIVELGSTVLVFRDRARLVRPELADLDAGDELTTFSAALDDVRDALSRVAPTTVPVTIVGETGTGKEVATRFLHERSGRRGALVAVNCAAIPKELVEGTLFGHRRGAFSGAIEDRPGLIRAADKGTLLLDEVADLPLAAQAALLRVLQEREVLALGETRPIPVDLRVVVATQTPLAELVDAGRFRADLMARLGGLSVRLPALGERREDLGLLVRALLPRAARERATFTAEAARALFRHPWPMNVRELERCLAAAVALAGGGEIRPEHLAGTIAATPRDAEGTDDPLLAELTALLGEHQGNLSAVARAMGKGRMQIQRWMKRYQLDPESFPPVKAQLGRYLILERLGEGGMGVVMAARDPDLDRKIAIKILRETDDEKDVEQRRDRLIREAKVMAQLAHPNVITVYDVGVESGEVFVAMELIDGGTLKAWLRDEPHTWREVLGRFLAAGAGLAAAHAAGIVHRDFKPDNVLLGTDARVVVTDFGLSRTSPRAVTSVSPVSSDPAPPHQGDAKEPPSAGHLLSPPHQGDAKEPPSAGHLLSLTSPGAIMGTPSYMSPEQHRGDPTDARTDQFAFCASLYEALFDELPFAVGFVEGMSEREALALEVLQGRVRPPPVSTTVPAWVTRIVVRGLAVDPDERWPSMAALLAALASDPAATRRRRLAIAAGVLAVAAALAGVWLVRGRTAAPCTGAEKRLAGLWDPERRQAVLAALPAETGAQVTRRLDAYAQAWVQRHHDICEASYVRHEQSDAALDVRMTCLDARLHELGSLAGLLAHADLNAIRHAVDAADKLEDLAVCDDTTVLPLPRDPGKRAAAVSLLDAVQRARTLDHLGHFREARELLAAIAPLTGFAAYPPVEAAILIRYGSLQGDLGHFDAERDLVVRGIAAADEGHADRERVFGYHELINMSTREGHYAEAHSYARLAEAALARIGGDVEAQLAQLELEGMVYNREGKAADAIRLQRQAVELAERTFGPDGFRTGVALTELSTSLARGGKLDEAMATDLRAAAIIEHTAGHDMPIMARLLGEQGVILYRQGKVAESVAPMQAGLEIQERLQGPESLDVATSLLNLGSTLDEVKRFDEGRKVLLRSIAIFEKQLGADNPTLAGPLVTLGQLEVDSGHPADAIPYYERSLPLIEKDTMDGLDINDTRFQLGSILVDSGKDPQRGRSLVVLAAMSYTQLKNTAKATECNDWLAKHPAAPIH